MGGSMGGPFYVRGSQNHCRGTNLSWGSWGNNCLSQVFAHTYSDLLFPFQVDLPYRMFIKSTLDLKTKCIQFNNELFSFLRIDLITKSDIEYRLGYPD